MFQPFWLPQTAVFQNEDLSAGVLDYLMSCHNNTDGGFGNHPSDEPSSVDSTAKTIICLNLFNKSSMIKRNEVASFFWGCQNSDRAFAFTVSRNDLYPSSLESTYYSIMALNLTGYLPKMQLHQQKLLNWLISHYNVDGGFHGDETVLSNEYYTFLAISALDILKALDLIDKNMTINYLLASQARKNPEITITTSRLLTLFSLQALDRLNLTISTTRLARCQNKDGGYRKKKISLLYQSEMSSTFHAILGLQVIGKTERIKKSNVLNWISSCQNEDGGFGNKQGSKSTLTNTFHAIMSLYYLTDR